MEEHTENVVELVEQDGSLYKLVMQSEPVENNTDIDFRGRKIWERSHRVGPYLILASNA
jgi:hypothetical protein